MRDAPTTSVKERVTYHCALELLDQLWVPADFFLLFHFDGRHINRNVPVRLLDGRVDLVRKLGDAMFRLRFGLQGGQVHLFDDHCQTMETFLRLFVSLFFVLHLNLVISSRLPGEIQI